ncbi:MAG: type II toxin-antitoxin system VapC family toxin [Salinisphaera sp.]|nr:type II toxin-antitoxin system VapC family toxin [Salinisphaera sp.]
MKARVYIETSIVSLLAARPSNNVRAAAHQSVSWKWWDQRSSHFDIFVSEFVLAEVAQGDPAAAQRRMNILNELTVLQTNAEVTDLGDKLVEAGAIPEAAKMDAFHIASATVNGMDYLMTWNCKHIANAVMRPRIETLCSREGYAPPIICTPEELLED